MTGRVVILPVLAILLAACSSAATPVPVSPSPAAPSAAAPSAAPSQAAASPSAAASAPASSAPFFAAAMDPTINLCGDGTQRTITVAHSVDVLDVTQQAIHTAIQNRADAIMKACPNLTIKYSEFDAQQSVAKQIADVQSIILTKPDALIFSAVDVKGSLPAAQAAHDAGIKVIDIRASLAGSPAIDAAFYASDEPSYAKGTTDWITSWLTANPGKTLNIGLIYGAAAQVPQLSREDSIKTLAASMPDRIKIVADAHGDWNLAKAQSIAQDWLLAHPEINYISAANDIMAQGVVNAVKTANKAGEVMISGYDVQDDAIKRIQDGTQTLDVGAMTGDYGKAMDVAVGIVLGVWNEKSFINTKVWAVTKDTVAEYLQARKVQQGY
jgi:ribose transport system substrate-binding protein